MPRARHLAMLAAWLLIVFGMAPVHAETFSAQVIDALRRIDPTVKITPVDRDEIKLEKNDGQNQVFLHNLRRMCELQPTRCDEHMNTFAQVSLDTLGQGSKQGPTPAQLRIVIRSTAYVASITQIINQDQRAKRHFFSRPLLGDAVQLLVSDRPQAVSPVDSDTLAQMKLSDAQAWTLALQNNTGALGPQNLNRLDKEVIGLGGNFFAPTWILTPHWTQFAKENAVRQAWACVYDADLALFAYNDSSKLEVIKRACQRWGAKAKKPVSVRVARWTATSNAWEPLDD